MMTESDFLSGTAQALDVKVKDDIPSTLKFDHQKFRRGLICQKYSLERLSVFFCLLVLSLVLGQAFNFLIPCFQSLLTRKFRKQVRIHLQSCHQEEVLLRYKVRHNLQSNKVLCKVMSMESKILENSVNFNCVCQAVTVLNWLFTIRLESWLILI